MQSADWLASLFRAIDRMNVEGFAAHLAEDVEFQFGNAPVIKGAARVSEIVAQFFDSIGGISHEILEHWLTADGTVVCRGMSSYTRRDGRVITVPFANIMKVAGGRASEYRIFIDLSPLWGP